MTVALRPLTPADHDRLLAMTIAFNDEDNHPLTSRQFGLAPANPNLH